MADAAVLNTAVPYWGRVGSSPTFGTTSERETAVLEAEQPLEGCRLKATGLRLRDILLA